MTIHKEGVTAAEILLLRQIHGDDAVIDIVQTKLSTRSHAEELRRLSEIYGPTIVAQAWPGVAPRLPSNLKDAGLLVEEKDPEAEMERITGAMDPALIAVAEAVRGGADPSALA
jgi:hypothetical protein